MSRDLASRSAAELAAAVRDGELRAADVTDAFLARIAAHDHHVGAFVEVFEESARAEAEAYAWMFKRSSSSPPSRCELVSSS